LHIKGTQFRDEQGRTLILRGVNLGGSSKVPFRPDGATHIREGFYNHRDVSFVGRPFPLEEADEHFSRLRGWGMTFVRYLITWEAVEHAGPGIYDEEYLDYVYQVARRAGEHGIELFIDPHQDVWSRMSGGDGAPGWTFEAAGMDVRRFSETGAAIVHAIHGDPLPRMIWPTNSSKLASATMFTLFFGGNVFAPKIKIDGEPVQEFLQGHYIRAIKQVAERLKGLPSVVGYDTMNEPSPGYIGWPDLREPGGLVQAGESPSPYQAMLLGAGFPQEVELWSLGFSGARRRGRRMVNPGGQRAWREGVECIWREHGVWDQDARGEPRLLNPHYFARIGNSPVDFANEHLLPFLQRCAREIRTVDPGAIIFVEGQPRHSPVRWDPEAVPNAVHADHWYDGAVLYTKTFIPFLGVDYHRGKPVLGRKRVQQSFVEQLARIRTQATELMGGIPTLIGEFGIAFDLRGKRAYRTGNFSQQVRAMDRTWRAMEANLLSGTLWNYTADNDNQRGDQWNGEDLSIFSRDQQSDPYDINSGGRALEAIVRPYARKVAGEPLEMAFSLKDGHFSFAFRHYPDVEAPTEIFVPNLQYPDGYEVEASDGEYEIDRDAQALIYRHRAEQPVHRIQVRRPRRR
jgi:hypothetical protein